MRREATLSSPIIGPFPRPRGRPRRVPLKWLPFENLRPTWLRDFKAAYPADVDRLPVSFSLSLTCQDNQIKPDMSIVPECGGNEDTSSGNIVFVHGLVVAFVATTYIHIHTYVLFLSFSMHVVCASSYLYASRVTRIIFIRYRIVLNIDANPFLRRTRAKLTSLPPAQVRRTLLKTRVRVNNSSS